MVDDPHGFAELMAGVRAGEAFVLITEAGMTGTFPNEQINSILALALLARVGMDREKAVRVVKAAHREHKQFADQHPELKPN